MSQSDKYELNVVHPAVDKWLSDHGYTYQHEVNMPDYGRADFVAIHADGHMLIVECKPTGKRYGYAIMQVMDYRAQLNPDAEVAIAVPSHTMTHEAIDVCKRRGVLLIEVEVTDKPDRTQLPVEKRRKQFDAFKLTAMWIQSEFGIDSGVTIEDQQRLGNLTQAEQKELLDHLRSK